MRQPLAGAAGPPAEEGEQDPDVTAEAAEVQALAQHRTGRSGCAYIFTLFWICVLMFASWRSTAPADQGTYVRYTAPTND